MIYLFYGTDAEKARAKAFDWIAAARAKEPNLAYIRLAREEITRAALEGAAQSGGLFVKRLLVLIDDPFPPAHAASGEETGEEEVPGPTALEECLDALASSDNAIVILAPKLAGTKAKKIVPLAKKVYVCDKTARGEMRGFNSALVNALAARDRAKLWLEVNRALYAGDVPEQVHGLLHWKARDLMEKGSRTWRPEESRQLSLALIELLQDSRRRGLDLSESLERFALSI